MNSLKEISTLLGNHYRRKFEEHGATPEGVDWGPNPEHHRLRLARMLAVLELGQPEARPSLLDVGCGYGSLLDLIKERKLPLTYMGIDICESMIEAAKARHPDAEWLVGDILEMRVNGPFDYVVCNGILTQKLDVSIRDMDHFMQAIVTRMFELCRIGIAFNVMTTHVNFMVPHLYYRNPVELLGWCMSAITPRVRLDHAYPLFEYTVYLYREDATKAA
jgi:2-polyprenyl-3-methyl-5-hydroxy-6-metoxy-1,4-benzoquinol methylase